MGNKWFGWCGRILYVDLGRGRLTTGELPEELARRYLGQSGSGARLLHEMTRRGQDPFDPGAPLIFGAGPLCGTQAPCSGRFSLTFKSPLTGIFADSNCGGHFGPELKMAGYDHIVLTGISEMPVYLRVDNDQVELRDARHLWGLTTRETDAAIKQELGDSSAQVACIGQAGENRVRMAAVICNQARAAARCGPGAAMGAKGLKAVAVRGDRGLSIYDQTAFREAIHEAQEAVLADPLYDQAKTFGT